MEFDLPPIRKLMEAAAGVAAARGVSLTVSSAQASRKEWRAVSEQSLRNSTSEVLETFHCHCPCTDI